MGYSFLLLCTALAIAANVDADKATLDTLVEEFWQWRLRENPEFATSVDDHRNDDLLEQFTQEVFESRKNATDAFMKRANALDVQSLERSDQITLALLKDNLQTFVDGYKWKDHNDLTPMSNIEGPHIDYTYVLDYYRFHEQADFDNYVKRLIATPTQIDQFITLMRRAINLKRTSHSVSMARVPSLINKITALAPKDTGFYDPFKAPLDNRTFSSDIKVRIRQDAAAAIRDSVLPSFRKLSDFVANEYLPNTRSGYGVGSWPDGQEYYKACLKFHLSVDVTAKEVHARGLQEVARIKGEMQKIMDNKGFNGTLVEYIKHLKADKRLYYNTSEEMLQGYRDQIFKVVQPKLPLMFKNIPNMPLIVRAMSYDGPLGMYTGPSEDGSRPGVFDANVMAPETKPKFDMMALTLHEAEPGHHFQAIYSMKQTLPLFRKNIDMSKYYSIPFHFPFYTAYAEGWALYAETLGIEMDVYRDQDELFGKYSSEMFRACRLVVDTGLHAFEWDRQRSIDYMAAHITDPLKAIETEIDRYITWPGQACAYKYGELKIEDLRQKAEKTLGAKFDVRDFHEEVLSAGGVPLSVLEQVVDEWVAKVQASSSERNTWSLVLTFFMCVVTHFY